METESQGNLSKNSLGSISGHPTSKNYTIKNLDFYDKNTNSWSVRGSSKVKNCRQIPYRQRKKPIRSKGEKRSI